jgi:putative aminopeptidase FrvX
MKVESVISGRDPYAGWFDLIGQLVLCHSPSGAEEEIDRFLLERLSSLEVEHRQDEAGNIVARIAGRNASRAVAITAHKDEIAAVVKNIEPDGRIRVRKLGGAFPWVYGEGIVDLLGDRCTIQGVLSFGSRHVSHESPQKCFQEDKALMWEHVWVDTKLDRNGLAEAGIRPGTRMVVGKHRKAPFRLGDYIASYTLDNKASVAVLLNLAQRLKQPEADIYLVFSAKEEVGALGAMYLTQRQRIDSLIALEICPKSTEYPIAADTAPTLVCQDGHGLYDEALNREIAETAACAGIECQFVVLSGFGSDASLAMKNGHVGRAACLGFPTDNTHGYEIAHFAAIEGCLQILEAWCSR